MWRNFAGATAYAAAGPATAFYGGLSQFGFPIEQPPAWTALWRQLVGQISVTPDIATRAQLIDSFVEARGVRTLGFVNAHALNSCVGNPAFAADLLALDLLVRDGIGVEAMYRLAGAHPGLNLNGTDLLPELIMRFAGRRVALFGTRLALAERVAAQLRDELGCTTIVRDGFQSEGHYLEVVGREHPDLVVLGMGMPKQERIARLIGQAVDADVAVVCGGAILDFLSGHVTRAPVWMRRGGLEWAYRLSLEPKRLFGRYVIGNPLFLMRSALLALLGRRVSEPARREPPAPPRPALGERPPRPELRLVVSDTPPAPPPHAPEPAPNAATTFSANRPVVLRDELFGRQKDLNRLLKWVLDQSGNALIYGPRGYGKTSLARVFGEVADSLGHVVIYASCSKQADFSSLIRAYLAEVPNCPAVAAAAASGEALSVQQVAGLLAAINDMSLVFIVDEYDRLEVEATRDQLVELIKDVSDLTAQVRFLLVGVATDVQQILGYHPSIHRSVTTVPLARLGGDAIDALFRQKAAADGLDVAGAVVDTVVRLTAGSAYHAQLIGQKLVAAARAGGRSVGPAELDETIDEIVGDAMRMDPALAALAAEFASHPRGRGVLLDVARAALGDRDDLVRAAVIGAADPALAAACRDWLTGIGVLEASGPGSGMHATWRFVNAFTPQLLMMMEHLLAVQRR